MGDENDRLGEKFKDFGTKREVVEFEPEGENVGDSSVWCAIEPTPGIEKGDRALVPGLEPSVGEVNMVS